ncbi:MAG: hypothetical protein R6U84_05905 [Candidatus Cloacimonadales bacterium]
MLSYANKLNTLAQPILEADIAKLRQEGFEELAIHDICTIVAYFNFVNRMAVGLGVELEARFTDNSSV